MGIQPEHMFDFCCFLEDIKPNKKILHLNADQLFTVFNGLRNNVDILISESNRYQYVEQSDVKVSSECFEMFEIRTRSQSIWMDERSVKQLLRLQPFIKRYVELLLIEQKKCREAFIHTLYVYCSESKCNDSRLECKLRKFLIYSSNLQCKCMPYHEFIIEMAVHWLEWVCECIPIFFNVSMVEEVARLYTFKHKGAAFFNTFDINLAAKIGLYFSDDCGDSLRCCFCLKKIILLACCNKILELHFRQSPECQFLINPENSGNLPMSENNSDLKTQFFKTISLIDKDLCMF